MSRKNIVPAATTSGSPVIASIVKSQSPINPKIHGSIHDAEFSNWMVCTARTVSDQLKSGKKTVVRTDAKGLFDLFLANLPAGERQYHRCRCCEQFFRNYGNLAILEENGNLIPLLTMVGFPSIPKKYNNAMTMIHQQVVSAEIVGPFYTIDPILGHQRTGIWTHFYLTMPPKARYTGIVNTAEQAEASRIQDFNTVKNAINVLSQSVLNDTVTILESSDAYRGDQVIDRAKWLRDLKVQRAGLRKKGAKDRVLWHAVLNAPEGFCHPRSGILGTIFDSLEKGLSHQAIVKSFSSKMSGTEYQRSKAAPAAQTVKRAAEIVEKLNAEKAFERRFALLSEIVAEWSPRPRITKQSSVTPTSGMFANMRTKDTPAPVSYRMPPENQIRSGGKMTWEKFQQKVLPTAEKIAFHTSNVNYGGIVAPVNRQATPILQWDTKEQRNPFSWYTYPNRIDPIYWSLRPNHWHDVTAIMLKPSMWFNNTTHHGRSVFFLLKDCRDAQSPGLCLFPEILKGEFHEIRSAIEELNRTKRLKAIAGEHAAGAMLSDGQNWNARIRVWSKGTVTEYTLDRWE